MPSNCNNNLFLIFYYLLIFKIRNIYKSFNYNIFMRRDIVHIGADQLSYEIRGIVNIAEKIEYFGQEIFWENVGDPINKGQKIPNWIKDIVKSKVDEDYSWGYSPTKGLLETRNFLADRVNSKAGTKITAEDILFFNGLGDAISKVYGQLKKESRIIGPSPAYPTHSSAEGGHSGYEPVTYKLDPHNNWLPDLDDIRNKVKYNDTIVGILIINPDNPTGMVYPKNILREIVNIAKEYNLFIISDEIYGDLTYNGRKAISMSELIDNLPTIIMKGISKELPWPGSRCGWIEVYNKNIDKNFSKYIKSILDAKMLEVCSTTLPQATIPDLLSSPKYKIFLSERTREVEKRANYLYENLKNIKGILINKTYGAFYYSIVFEEGVLKEDQILNIKNKKIKELIEKEVKNSSLDKRFVYYLLGSTGICVVPLTSFSSELKGFRMTLLEQDFDKFKWIVETLKNSIQEYLKE